MTSSTPGKIERTSLRPEGMRDLTSGVVRDQLVAEARKDANLSLIRNRRAAERAKQGK